VRKIIGFLDEMGAEYSYNDTTKIVTVHDRLKNGIEYKVLIKPLYSDGYTMVVAYMTGKMVAKNKLKLYETFLTRHADVKDAKYERSAKDGSIRIRLDMDDSALIDCAHLIRRLRDIRTLVSGIDDDSLLTGDGDDL
jgi:hypothetical protein